MGEAFPGWEDEFPAWHPKTLRTSKNAHTVLTLRLYHYNDLPTLVSDLEIIELYSRFKRLDKDKSGLLTASDLLAIPEFASNPLGPSRLVPILMSQINDTSDDALFLGRTAKVAEGKKAGGGLSFRGFIKIMSVFHPSASIKEKLQFAFKVFDVDDDGLIDRRELVQVLKLMVGSNLDPEELDEVVRRTLAAMNAGQDEQVRWEDFYLAMSHVDVRRLMSLQPSTTVH